MLRSFVFVLLLSALWAQADVPGWLRESATAAHPTYVAGTKGVALFHEETVRVEATGKQTTQTRKAVKILTREGKGEAVGMISYDSKGSKVKDFKAWLIYPNGKTKEYSKKDLVEGSSHPDFMLYSTRRYYGINASSDVDPGTVFGYESTLEEDTVFSQFVWYFQDDLPHLLSRFQLTVPDGWRAEAKAYEGAKAEAEIAGSTYTWEARKLNPLVREPAAPQLGSMLPRIAVSMLPPAQMPLAGGPIACFRTWKDVANWNASLSDPQAQLSAAIESKAAQLSEGKSKVLDKIRALAEHVQQIRYVAVSTNTSRGGGYVPHKADEVFRLAYGDCKDKANLLRTMLKSIQVVSYNVVIYSGDPRHTKEDFPSPQQFNHAILAISVPEDTQAPAVVQHPKLGRLMIFDPTDTYVPFGHLPGHEQGSNALLVTGIDAGEEGYLIRTPQTKAAENHTQRQWKLRIETDGSLQGQLIETTEGQAAFADRAEWLTLSKPDFTKAVTAAFSREMTGVVIDSIEPDYDSATERFRLEVKFHCPAYAKIMNGKLWMLRSVPIGFGQLPNVNKKERDQPIVLRPLRFSEEVVWTVPANLKLDELPEADRKEGAFAKYQTVWKQNGTEISAKRELEVQSAVLPVKDYALARDFFQRFHGAGDAAVVLVAK